MNTIPGTGKYLKRCKGCKKEFYSDARNTQFGPPDLCKCADKRKKTRVKRARERRAYHRNKDHFRNLSRVRADARKMMEEYLRRHFSEPACEYPGCKHRGWESWKHTLQVHHKEGKELTNPDYSQGIAFGDFQLRRLLGIYCRNHHEYADRAAVSGHGEIVLWESLPETSFVDHLVALRIANPKRYFKTPLNKIRSEWQLSASS